MSFIVVREVFIPKNLTREASFKSLPIKGTFHMENMRTTGTIEL